MDHIGSDHHLKILLFPVFGGNNVQLFQVFRIRDEFAGGLRSPTADAGNYDCGLFRLGIPHSRDNRSSRD